MKVGKEMFLKRKIWIRGFFLIIFIWSGSFLRNKFQTMVYFGSQTTIGQLIFIGSLLLSFLLLLSIINQYFQIKSFNQWITEISIQNSTINSLLGQSNLQKAQKLHKKLLEILALHPVFQKHIPASIKFEIENINWNIKLRSQMLEIHSNDYENKMEELFDRWESIQNQLTHSTFHWIPPPTIEELHREFSDFKERFNHQLSNMKEELQKVHNAINEQNFFLASNLLKNLQSRAKMLGYFTFHARIEQEFKILDEFMTKFKPNSSSPPISSSQLEGFLEQLDRLFDQWNTNNKNEKQPSNNTVIG